MENKKFFDFEGIINRRYFIINYLIVKIAESILFTTPALILLFSKPDLLANLISGTNIPVWWNIWVIIIGILKIVLLVPSILRRVRDIADGDDKYIKSITALLAVIIAGAIFMDNIPHIFAYAVKWSAFLTIILLMIIKGNHAQKSEIVRFNWGAFLGTWIWGIFNKSYKTLFMIPLFFTTGSFYFALICGLKGNEWSYKNNTKNNLEEFHQNQSKQAILWTALTPIIFILCMALSVVCSLFFINEYQKKHPDFINEIHNYSAKIQSDMASSYFTKIEISDNEYKFYINPKTWIRLSEKNKLSISETAGNYVMIKKSIKSDESGDIPPEVMNKIKIYSTFNNEILGEFEINPSANINNSYKFNNHPSLP